LAVARDAWAQAAVHRASSYFCAHCGPIATGVAQEYAAGG